MRCHDWSGVLTDKNDWVLVLSFNKTAYPNGWNRRRSVHVLILVFEGGAYFATSREACCCLRESTLNVQNYFSKMGTRDDEYDYLFKGNVLSKGGCLAACWFCRETPGDNVRNWGSPVKTALTLKLALLVSTATNGSMITVYPINNY